MRPACDLRRLLSLTAVPGDLSEFSVPVAGGLLARRSFSEGRSAAISPVPRSLAQRRITRHLANFFLLPSYFSCDAVRIAPV